MLIFIGGAPRIGKSILSKELANKLNTSYASTDALRWGAKQLKQISADDPLFILDRLDEWDNRKDFYTKYSTQEITAFCKTESCEVVKIVKGFIESTAYRNQSFILEGIALLPSLIDQGFLEQYKINYFCVGNTDFKSLFDYSWNNRSHGDWLSGTDRSTFEKVIKFSCEFSKTIRKEAEEKQVQYFELHSSSFNEDIKKIVDSVLKTSNI